MEAKLQEYARLLIEVGLNVQKGQDLVISSPVECASFARMCAKAAYAAGCREVVMRWRDDVLTRERYLHAADEVFDTVPQWQRMFFDECAQSGAASLHIAAADPENLLGVDQDRITRAQRAGGEALREYYRLQMANAFPWCVAAMPIPSWAEKVFPGLSGDQGVDKLWDAIFSAIRITGDGHAVARWREHLDTLHRRCDILNSLDLESLHYTNSLGTDLSICLPEDHVWCGGSSRTTKGVPFIANIPTEEIFTAPLRDGIDGVVYASMPFVCGGTVVEDFHFVIRDGKIREVHAAKGEEALRAAVSVDEGACRFGEVALVPYDSPISSQKLLYYNTLFDENASCHLAFGEAYPECIKGGESMSKEELSEHGLNDSITHEDFMVGTADLQITGRTWGGAKVPIFVDGNFVI